MLAKMYCCNACTYFLFLIIYYHIRYEKSIVFLKKNALFCNFLQMHIFRTYFLPILNKFPAFLRENCVKPLTKAPVSDIILLLSIWQYDSLAQAVEHLTFNQGVPGSIPGWVTTKRTVMRFSAGGALFLSRSPLKKSGQKRRGVPKQNG